MCNVCRMYGHYDAMKQNFDVADFVTDLTGAIVETLTLSDLHQDLARNTETLYRDINSALENGTLVVAYLKCKADGEAGTVTSEGLVRGHGYIINCAKEVKVGKDKFMLLRVNNPWGSKTWTGAWSDE